MAQLSATNTRVTLQTAAVTGASADYFYGAGSTYGNANKALQATVTGTGAVTATVAIQVSMDNVNWLTAGTITLSGTTSASDGFVLSAAPWQYIRSNVTALTGTGASVTVLMGL